MRRILELVPLLVIFILCSANPAFAEGGSAMDFRYDTAVWAVVVFVLLFVILRIFAWKPILEGLQKREETIRTSLEDAKKTRDEMAAMSAKFEKDMAEANQRIPALMDEARKDAEAMVADMRTKAAAEIQTERERLRREIEIAKDQSIKELWEQSAQLATLISAKAIGRSLNEEDHRRLLDEAMQEISHASRN